MFEKTIWLVDGKIPANSICPFRVICEIAKAGQCHHQGYSHPAPFSCAAARGFAIIQKS